MKSIARGTKEYLMFLIGAAAAYEFVYYVFHGKFPPFWD